MLTLIFFTLLSLLGFFFIYRRFCCHQFFKRAGIPGPEPHWLFGNVRELFNTNRHLVLSEWSGKYGPVFGYFLGGKPVLVVSTPETAEQVCIKQFASYQSHYTIPVQADADANPGFPMAHMLFAKGDTWKRLRTICNPAFTSGKLKSYMGLLKNCEKDLIQLFSEKEGQTFDIRETFQLLTLEVIGSVGFGIEFNAIRSVGKNNEFLKKLREFLHSSSDPPISIMSSLFLSEIVPIIKRGIFLQEKVGSGFFGPIHKICANIRDIITLRQEGDVRKNDILQSMVDICANEASAAGNKKSMTEYEMVSQSLLLFVAGYETTSSSLGFASYLLAKNPEKQEKLAKELAQAFPCNEKGELPSIDYDTVMNSIPYLDWVCRETLRLYPVALNFLSRLVFDEGTIEGYHIPKNLEAVYVDTWTIHRNPDYWGPVDPNKFYPERFAPEQSEGRHPAAYLPFGLGPRQCLGMRLALLEMKFTLANMLLRFRIEPPYPDFQLEVNSINGPMTAVGGIPVKLLARG